MKKGPRFHTGVCRVTGHSLLNFVRSEWIYMIGRPVILSHGALTMEMQRSCKEIQFALPFNPSYTILEYRAPSRKIRNSSFICHSLPIRVSTLDLPTDMHMLCHYYNALSWINYCPISPWSFSDELFLVLENVLMLKI